MPSPRFPMPTVRLPLAIVLLAGAAACSGDEIAAPPAPIEGTLTVDASAGWAFASLADEQTVTVADPRTSDAWDIGFNATNVMLNGGAAGPGGVLGYCICQNADATNDQVLAMTAASELADFESVTADDIPAAGAFQSETLVPAIGGWYSGAGATATASDKVWLLRLAGTGAGFAKIRVASLEAPTAANPGTVHLQYALQAAADAPFGETQELEVSTASPVVVDLNTGTVSANAAEGWDLRFDGYTLRLNGGVSGTGSAGAAEATEAFDAITTASVDSRAYRADSYGGVFSATDPGKRWYKYNIQGDHRISPTFNVYLLRRGDDVYKVQLIDYYDPTDPSKPRRISFRYAKITE